MGGGRANIGVKDGEYGRSTLYMCMNIRMKPVEIVLRREWQDLGE
jgi:hypothetical protein